MKDAAFHCRKQSNHEKEAWPNRFESLIQALKIHWRAPQRDKQNLQGQRVGKIYVHTSSSLTAYVKWIFKGKKANFIKSQMKNNFKMNLFLYCVSYFSLARSKRIRIYDWVQSAGHCTPLIHFTSSELEIGTLSSIKHQPCQSKSTLSLRSSSPCAVAMVTSGLGVVLLSKHAVCKDEWCCEKDECINELDYEQLCTQCCV